MNTITVIIVIFDMIVIEKVNFYLMKNVTMYCSSISLYCIYIQCLYNVNNNLFHSTLLKQMKEKCENVCKIMKNHLTCFFQSRIMSVNIPEWMKKERENDE